MRASVKSNRLTAAIAAAIIAAIVAIGLSVLPAQAHASYTVGTPASQVTAKYSTKKAKIVGKWKMVNSSNASERSILKAQKKRGKINKFTFKKNGTAVEKNYNKSASKYTWKAKAKKSGYMFYNGYFIGNIKVKGKKLYLSIPNSGLTRTYKRM